MKTFVSRLVRKLDQPRGEGVRPPQALESYGPPLPLESWRDERAWVLQGEPGAGKTTALEHEAAETNGKFMRIADFIEADIDDGWRGKTLFLDGLDETRASTRQGNVLPRISAQLRRLGRPKLRIACRAADWYGSSDRADLEAAYPDAAAIVELQLEPLGDEDILKILRENHGVADPRAFVEHATQRGVDSLLGNPQTLGLLAEATEGGQWPRTRDDTSRLAYEKLAYESNKRCRDLARGDPRPIPEILDAAGQLCAVLLLADKMGFALDPARAGQGFVEPGECAPPNPSAATWALGSKLFIPEGVEHLVPVHRSVAEYLAARWVAQRIDRDGLPLGRVMALLLGRDGCPVAGLRGLYAWLALYCNEARDRFIDTDPLTVLLYGDVAPMTVDDKHRLLDGLRRDAEQNAEVLSRVRATDATHPLRALVVPELVAHLLSVLRAGERDEASQAYLSCVLEVLWQGERLEKLADAVLAIVRNDSYWPRVRVYALGAWLHWDPEPEAAVALLDDVSAGRVADPADDMRGMLLRHLYPKHIGPEELLAYIHTPDAHGTYGLFLYELPDADRVPTEHIPPLLDGLAARGDLWLRGADHFAICDLGDRLLQRGIEEHGDKITDDRLFSWLGIAVDEYGEVEGDGAAKAFAGWIRPRPERYKTLLSLAFSRCAGKSNPRYCVELLAHRLRAAPEPADLGAWHLEQVESTDDEALAREHLRRAVQAVLHDRSAAGLSLEMLESWAAAHPERSEWLAPMLSCEIPDRRWEHVTAEATRKQERENARRERTRALQPFLREIEAGTAAPYVMSQAAGVWMGRFADTYSPVLEERFEKYIEGGRELLPKAEAGFCRCPERTDLPAIEEIVDLALRRREHYIRLPCLIGMELRWRSGREEVDALPEETLRRMVAFRLTDGSSETPDWFVHLVRSRSTLVAGVLAYYGAAALRARMESIYGISELEHDPAFEPVAALAAPRLLAAFPLRPRVGYLGYLEDLLKATLRHARQELPSLIENKLSAKGMAAGQKVYWLAAAMLLDPKRYEDALWRHVGRSQVKTNHLSRFLRGHSLAERAEWQLSAGTVGTLIERIAPHAQVAWPVGAYYVDDSMERGDHVRALITSLGAMASAEAEQEIDRLIRLPSLHKLKRLLERTRHELEQRRRELEFRFLSVAEVARVLANGAPADQADLAALILDHLDDIARDVRRENDDGVRAFWNVENGKPTGRREENLCRDEVLERLRPKLDRLGVRCDPEGDYANDKAADLRVSYRAELEVPIEIKRDSNRKLWSGLRAQLIDQYAVAPKADGYGIYLVLWFGGNGLPAAADGGKKPRTPEELRARLEAQLEPSERQRVFVRVLDVSWPQGKQGET